MGLFNSLKGKVDVGTDTPPDQAPSVQNHHEAYSTAQEKRRLFGQGATDKHDFAPPPGPPPSHSQSKGETFLPPPGPPPSQTSSNPPPYHDWTVIPDTALLPPPPPLPQDYSPTNNATYDSAARAHEWCARYPVYTPSSPSHELHALAQNGHLSLEKPQGPLAGRGFELRKLSPSTWTVHTRSAQQDAIILSSIPLYFAAADSPLLTGQAKTIYFEIVVKAIANSNSGIAVGFAAKPYPPWRLPGWHRASVGVHGDDGRRFVNDSWGGREFVDAFKRGETIGIGMTLSTLAMTTDGASGVQTSAFVTRNGRRDEGWEWQLDEERDQRDEGIEGLTGDLDLYPAIGVFGGVEFEVRFGDGLSWQVR